MGGSAVPDPAIRVRERVVHYEVEGGTVEEIRRSLDRGARRTEEGRFRGTTQWNVRWRYRYEPRGGSCVVADVDVWLEVTTTLPRWRGSARAGPEVVRWWAAYTASLEAHEAGHRDYAVGAANEVLRAVRNLRTSTCAHMPDEANARARWIVERYRELNRRYDAETRHGRTQGAGWPPGAPDGRRPR